MPTLLLKLWALYGTFLGYYLASVRANSIFEEFLKLLYWEGVAYYSVWGSKLYLLATGVLYSVLWAAALEPNSKFKLLPDFKIEF